MTSDVLHNSSYGGKFSGSSSKPRLNGTASHSKFDSFSKSVESIERDERMVVVEDSDIERTNDVIEID